jgi:hypothetical protein
VRIRGWIAFGLGAGAVAWAGALVIGAFVLPAYSGESCQATPGAPPICTASSQTEFAVNGWSVVELLGGVAFVAAIAFFALHRVCAGQSDAAAKVATCCIVVLAAFSWVTGLSIGPLVLPVVILLTASAWLVPRAQALRPK